MSARSSTSRAGEDLAELLARWADGLGCVEWAVSWLIATGWTDDAEFVAACIVQTECRGEPVACVDWRAVDEYAHRVRAPEAQAVAISLAYNLATEPWRLAGLPPAGRAVGTDRP